MVDRQANDSGGRFCSHPSLERNRQVSRSPAVGYPASEAAPVAAVFFAVDIA